MGRVLDAVARLPDAENTLIIYIVGDNGSSAEGGPEGSTNENAFFNSILETWQDNLKVIDELGGPKHFNHFPSAWAWAMDTPFQWTKQVASHFGGTRNPMIISWPAKITDKGGLRSQFHHVIDIMPTLLDAAGVRAPDVLNGIPQKPIDGISMTYTFGDAKASDRRKTQVFEMGVNRGIYQDGWFASSLSFVPWQPVRTGFDIDTAEVGVVRHRPATSHRPTTSPRQTPTSSGRWRICGGPKRRATTSSRSIGVVLNACQQS